ncbi:MAG TPA: mechanosensitive ion channel family protein [Candidatus Saccharimonadales bacterium]|nr:mechanosensitive ion channel family protein [Candidatus Saccharimonadales bacterium]
MIHLFADQQLDQAFERSKNLLDRVSGTFFNAESIITFIVAMTIAVVLGRIVAALLRRFTRVLSTRADKTQDLREVNQLRRIETLTVLFIALIRVVFVVFALYFWWAYSHPGQQPTALIGASALVAVIAGATIAPILRDLAYGGVMMAEHWFGVGDHVKLEPFGDLQGVVERVTLRSTRIRGLNGEIIWISNQNIQGVRVSPKGVRTLAIDIFVSDLEKGLNLIEQTNLRLPTGPLMVVRPLHIMHKDEVGPKLWHIVAVGETAPGREWLLQDYAVKNMKEMDEENKKPVLENEPIARYADVEADKRFARTVQNARKSTLQRKQLPSPEEFAQQLLLNPLKKSGAYARSKTRRNDKKPS